MFHLPCIDNWVLRDGSCQMCADLAFNCLFFAPLSLAMQLNQTVQNFKYGLHSFHRHIRLEQC
ncbi:unnamed protein product [Brassica rapa subsp. narinosa]